MAARIEAGAAITVGAFEAADPAGYGRVVRADDGTVSRIVEHHDATPDELAISLCNGGIMAVRLPLLFDLLDRVTNDNAKGEFYLTDIIGLAAGDGHRIDCTIVDRDEFIGVDSRHGQARAEAALQQRLRYAALDAGVTMQAPETVFLAADAVIERDVIIEPNVVIGSDCHIGEGSIIRAFSHLEGARLGACCIVGPYARLRPGTDAGDGVKVGNFVEIKNTRLDAGAKANHLTYLGDATIGSEANIGAGTITCNYDGFGKYRTLIGDGAFIGSNTALVAPVSIGARAIIGAGSTITCDVPEDSIAFTRAPLTEKKQAAAAFREKRIAAKAAKTNSAKKE
jgi:bifunctional UDP-N-acetylglucosamine pyrophosphorylase/glucosamine-1-phosphate N-acetyltransferase